MIGPAQGVSFLLISLRRLRTTLLAVLAVLPLQGAPLLPVAGQPAPTYTLEDCLQLALDRNPTILRAQHDIERSQGVIISAKSTLYPHASLNGRVEERNDDLFRQGTDPNAQRFRDFWTIQLQVIQSIYSGGVNRQQIAIAKLQHEAALIQLQATMDSVLQQVKIAVYALIVDQAQLDAQNLTIKLLQDEGTRQKDLFDAGRTTRFNVLRTQVSLGNQQATFSQTQTDLIAREIALSQLLNLEWSRAKAASLTPPFNVKANLDCPPVDKINVQDFITLALARRPELKVLRKQIEIGEHQIKIDKATNLPRVDAYIGDEQFRDQTLSSFNQSQNGYSFGLLGTWDIFDGFAGRGQVMTDTASLNNQRISADQLRLQIEDEVREAYARLLTAEQTVQSQTQNQQIAEESVKLSRISAESGYATLLDVLQATLDLTATRTDLIRSRQLYLNALADLEHAISLQFVDWPTSPGSNLPINTTGSSAGTPSSSTTTSDSPPTAPSSPAESAPAPAPVHATPADAAPDSSTPSHAMAPTPHPGGATLHP